MHSKNMVWGFLHNLWGIVGYTFRVRRGDIVVLQYPIKKYFKYICRVARLRGALTVTLIHDLGCMRRHRITEQVELSRLSLSDYIIATNSVMRTWCEEHGLSQTIGALELWDYPSPMPLRKQESMPADGSRKPVVVYAARLHPRRNAFLTKLEHTDLTYELHLYGQNDTTPFGKDNPNIHEHPRMASDTFIETVCGDYGLMWDGNSINRLDGAWGEYNRINTPMKVSFYLRSGMPVIINKDAALAPLIEKEGVGIVIDDLDRLGDILTHITPEQRQAMTDNVARIQQRINNGYYLQQTIEQAMAHLAARHTNND